jgi:hypothetical protein
MEYTLTVKDSLKKKKEKKRTKALTCKVGFSKEPKDYDCITFRNELTKASIARV